MTPEIADVESKYKVQEVPMKDILSDDKFNCRGHIAPIDVLALSRDIAERGLDQPIILQKWDKDGFKYRIVAGHRRHMAFRVNRAETIPAYIRDDLDELKARLLNLRENVHRKDLNILQEARSLQFFLDYKGGSFTEQELGDVFGQSRGWVQIRKDLLKLPEEIQNEAGAGMINSNHIRQLAKMKNVKEMLAIVKRIKEKKLRGESTKLTLSVKRASDALRMRERKKHEIEEMGSVLYDTIGPCLVTRVLAWAAGNISTVALYSDIREYCEDQAIPFTMPAFVRNALVGKNDAF
jgi:ParB/RepB/Spo0J family partition protein